MMEENKLGFTDVQDEGKDELANLPEGAAHAEGERDSDKLNELIERGKKKGKLSSKELMDVLEDMELESDQLDKLYDTLENLGIDTVGDDYLPELAEDVEPPLEEIEEIPEEEIVDPNTLIDSFAIDDPVRMYLKEIGRVNLLTPEEEIDLATRMSAGNRAIERLEKIRSQIKATGISVASEEELAELHRQEQDGEAAKQRLAEANLRLVVSIAKRYVGRGMLFLDLIQEGNLGLIKAVEKFDYTKDISFPPTRLGGSARRSPGPSPIRRAPSASPSTWWKPSTRSSASPASSCRNWGTTPAPRKSRMKWACRWTRCAKS
jgi:RNA polymerase primary sigma factor